MENRRRARRLRELTPAGARGGLMAAVRTLRTLELG
jgi:hypothetical protein